MSCAQFDLEVLQGKTFVRVFRWESLPIVYKAITAIAQAAPALITVVGHGVPEGWRVAVVSVKGMEEINAKNAVPRDTDYHKATVVSADSISLNDVNAADFTAYTSGGYVRYNTPIDLTGYTARMTIKDRIGGTVLATLTSAAGDIIINNTTKTVQIQLSAVATAAYTWLSGVYDIEMVSASGQVSPLAAGNVTLTQEVTT